MPSSGFGSELRARVAASGKTRLRRGNSSPDRRYASGDLLSLDELRTGRENSSLERERERVAEFEAEQLRQQRRGLAEAVSR